MPTKSPAATVFQEAENGEELTSENNTKFSGIKRKEILSSFKCELHSAVSGQS